MKKIIFIIALLLLFIIIINFNMTGHTIFQNQNTSLGYCPTMKTEAENYMLNNKNIETKEFDSASSVLFALNNGEVDIALIGRKAELREINKNVKEKVLQSGCTLVSNRKAIVDYHYLDNLEIHTYLHMDIAEALIPNSNVNYITKENINEHIKNGKVVLISWEDWRNEFELIVVMDGNKKAKEFRGVFLYKN
jgi:hypothetical protein